MATDCTINKRLTDCLTPAVKLAEERPTDRHDFTHHRPTNSSLLAVLEVEQVLAADQLPLLLVVISEHLVVFGCNTSDCRDDVTLSDTSDLHWSSENQRQIVSQLTDKLQDIKGQSLNDLIQENIMAVLEILLPRLENWPAYPASCHATHAVFTRLDGLTAGSHFGRALPWVLRWLDSWMVGARLRACRLMHHLLRVMQSSCLTKFGREKVLYDAFLSLLNSQDLEVLEAVQMPILHLLQLITNVQERGDPTKIRTVDHFISKLLGSLDMESNMNKKLIKTNLLVKSWRLLDQAALRWISSLSASIQHDLDVAGEHSVMLLNLWTDVCVKHPTAAKREMRVILPPLVKLAWKWSYGLTYQHLEREILEQVLTAQALTDPVVFQRYTIGIQGKKTSAEFLKLMLVVTQACQAEQTNNLLESCTINHSSETGARQDQEKTNKLMEIISTEQHSEIIVQNM